ncbi:MAG: 3-hydroxybutyryl-CoA dehydrogenase [Actinomycetota bacterium]
MPEPAGPPVARVGVVGGGQMGAGIAEVCARAGLDVVVSEVDEDRVARAWERIEGSLGRAVERGKLLPEGRAAALERIGLTTDIDALGDRQLVVEAIGESEPQKRVVLSRLDRAVEDPEAILGSNTSSIPIARLAAATSRPESVIGLHFFNPVPILPIVEVVPSCFTSPAVRERAEGFVGGALGMRIIHAPDRAGFVLNAMLVPFLLSAVRMLEGGFATADDIDASMVVGCGHPMGPLALADFIGLDTVMGIANSLHDASTEALHAPPALLVRMVSEGRLGRKTGEGFYRYTA